MEDTLIASYITLIIGYLIIENKVTFDFASTGLVIKLPNFFQDHESTVREFLPDRKFDLMVTVLKKFFNFMNLTASVSTCIKGKTCTIF